MPTQDEHYATVAEIMRLFPWSPAHIRNLAARHRWRRLGTRPQRYHLADVMACMPECRDTTPDQRM